MNFAAEIGNILGSCVCIVGVGNAIRKDDGVGVYLAGSLQRLVREPHVRVINAEDILESYAFEIADGPCEAVLLIDAVHTNSDPGTVLFGQLDDFGAIMEDFSTHKLSLRLAGKIWKNAGKKTYLLGIEAGDIDFGSDMTPAVKKSADMLRDCIISTLHSTRKEYVYEQ